MRGGRCCWPFVGSPENLQRLEAIRQNNLRLAGVLKDGAAADEHGPVIVWLSYNVHGNEPASSEAAMKTLYELVSGGRGGGDEVRMMGGGPAVWLKNTVVVIDPCINPDGRDRYVNWYNGVVGNLPNPNPQAREHREPWPRGRSQSLQFRSQPGLGMADADRDAGAVESNTMTGCRRCMWIIMSRV